jgi:uncharacterized protein (TIGR03790 family)
MRALRRAGVAGALWAVATAAAATELPKLLLPEVGLRPADIGVVVNEADPASVRLGEFYRERRGLAPEQVIRVSFTPGQPVMSLADFHRVQQQLAEAAPAHPVQAYALAWTQPYRVDCMSVTSAFAFGFDPAHCASGCRLTKRSPYYNSPSSQPFTDHALRPAMLLAGRDEDEARALIERGLRAEAAWPRGSAYLVSTRDANRNVRAQTYGTAQRALGAGYPVKLVRADELEDRPDVMFAFTGSQFVRRMRANRFLDGAVADHLTSLGGMLTDSPQTSALDWLSAGATGSYGTVVEPCNFREKFPDIPVLMGRYLGGETLVEAYWKSVLMPGQGVFIGDPLARPFGGVRVVRRGGQLLATTHTLRPGRYLLQSATTSIGPFRSLARITVPGYGGYDLRLPADGTPYYRLLPLR